MNIDQYQYGTEYWRGQRTGYFRGYARNHNNNPENKKADGTGKDEPKSYREQILEKTKEMAENIRKGSIQPKFQIGAQAFTVKEWEKFLEKFDAAEESLQEAVQAHVAEVKEQAEREAMRSAAECSASDTDKVTNMSYRTPPTKADETDGSDFGTYMYTGEEMELIRRAILNENEKSLKKPDTEEDDIRTQIVTKPDGSVVLQITTQYGVMELEVVQAQKFGLLVDVKEDRHPAQNDRNQAASVEWTEAMKIET